jgi:hypothetical protein
LPRSSIAAVCPSQSFDNEFVLAAARRLMRPADAPPLSAIRSLAYFRPVIDEVLELNPTPNYFQYLRQKMNRFGSTR